MAAEHSPADKRESALRADLMSTLAYIPMQGQEGCSAETHMNALKRASDWLPSVREQLRLISTGERGKGHALRCNALSAALALYEILGRLTCGPKSLTVDPILTRKMLPVQSISEAERLAQDLRLNALVMLNKWAGQNPVPVYKLLPEALAMASDVQEALSHLRIWNITEGRDEGLALPQLQSDVRTTGSALSVQCNLGLAVSLKLSTSWKQAHGTATVSSPAFCPVATLRVTHSGKGRLRLVSVIIRPSSLSKSDENFQNCWMPIPSIMTENEIVLPGSAVAPRIATDAARERNGEDVPTHPVYAVFSFSVPWLDNMDEVLQLKGGCSINLPTNAQATKAKALRLESSRKRGRNTLAESSDEQLLECLLLYRPE